MSLLNFVANQETLCSETFRMDKAAANGPKTWTRRPWEERTLLAILMPVFSLIQLKIDSTGWRTRRPGRRGRPLGPIPRE